MHFVKKFLFLLLIIVSFFSITTCKQKTLSDKGKITNKGKQFRILHIMSYHSPWDWTDGQLKGFQGALTDIDAEYNIFQMDTKQKTDETWKVEAGKQAKDLINTWKPDLVYTSDDNAQKYVAKYFINNSIPFVFSGVISDPKDYGYIGTTNMAGVTQDEHIELSVNFLKQIKPTIKKIAVITDNDPAYPKVIDKIKTLAKTKLSDFEFVSYDIITSFSELKRKIADLQNKADAICFLGISSFKDERGTIVPVIDVQKWIIENSNLPDFSFWSDRIPKGTLCSVAISPVEQGTAAGIIAHGILVEGKKPADYTFQSTSKGENLINLARAKKLGMIIDSDILLASNVTEKFEWEQ